MSFIQVDLKVIEVQAPAVARSLGIPEETVLAGLLRLWHRCWSLKADVITAIETRGFIPHPDACATLEAFGFLAATDDGKWRVKGADTYLRVREARAKGGAARAASAGRSAGKFTSTAPAQHQQDTSTTPALTPNTEHRTPNTEKTVAVRDSDLLCEDYQSIIGAKYAWQGAKDGAALKALLKHTNIDEIRKRWRVGLGLEESRWPSVRTVAQLNSKWNDLAGLHGGDWRSRIDPNAGFWPEGEEPQ